MQYASCSAKCQQRSPSPTWQLTNHLREWFTGSAVESMCTPPCKRKLFSLPALLHLHLLRMAMALRVQKCLAMRLAFSRLETHVREQ